MKITAIEATVIRLPWTQAFRGGVSETKGSIAIIDNLESLIVKLVTDEGIVGVGEGTLSYGGSKGRSMLEDLRAYLAPLVLGKNPFRIEKIMSELDLATMLEKRNPVKAALDLAIHDLIGKALGVPLYQYLGGKYREEVPLTYVVSFKDTAVLRNELAALKAGGFAGVIKVKGGTGSDDDIIEVINETLGRRNPIRVDFNGVLTPAEAIGRIRRWEREGIRLELMEQPAPLGDLDGLKRVADAIGSGVLVHWPIMDLTDAGNLIKSDCLAAAAITIPGVGGLHRSRQMAHAFESANIPCVIGSFLEMGITTAAQLHLTTAMRNFSYPLDILGSFGFHENRIIREELDIAPGFSGKCPEGHGLGIAPDEAMIAKYRITEPLTLT